MAADFYAEVAHVPTVNQRWGRLPMQQDPSTLGITQSDGVAEKRDLAKQ